MKRRVVITGMGCVTPLGAHVATVWNRLVAGESGVAEIAAFDAHDFPVRIAAEVRDWSIVDVAGDLCPWEHESRQTQFAVGAAIAAIRSSGLDSQAYDPRRVGVSMGCGEVFPNFLHLAQSLSGAWQDRELQWDRFLQSYAQLCTPTPNWRWTQAVRWDISPPASTRRDRASISRMRVLRVHPPLARPWR